MIGKKDLLIMTHLRRNSRETLTNMSRHTHIPVSTIYEKIRRNEDSIITKHTCLVDFTKLGFNTKAKLIIQANINYRNELRDFLLKHQNVNSLYRVNNGFDYLLECIFKNMKDLEEFAETLQMRFKVKRYDTYFVIDDLKREAFMTDPHLVEMVVD